MVEHLTDLQHIYYPVGAINISLGIYFHLSYIFGMQLSLSNSKGNSEALILNPSLSQSSLNPVAELHILIMKP